MRYKLIGIGLVAVMVIVIVVNFYEESEIFSSLQNQHENTINYYTCNNTIAEHQLLGGYIPNSLLFDEELKVIDSYILRQSIYIHTLKKVALPEITIDKLTISGVSASNFTSDDMIYRFPIPFTHLSFLNSPSFSFQFCDCGKKCIKITPTRLPTASVAPKRVGAHNMIKIDDEHQLTLLMDWIDFHLLLGVEHFYLYDNNSPVDLSAKMRKYFDAGQLTLVKWSCTSEMCGFSFWNSIQSMALRSMLVKFGHSVTWMLCMDIDEFLISPKNIALSSLLDKYEKTDALALRFSAYIYSNRFTNTTLTKTQLRQGNIDDPIFDQLLYCGEKDVPDRSKMIMRPQRVEMMQNIHDLEGFYRPRPPIMNVGEWRMNHYWIDRESVVEAGMPVLDTTAQKFATFLHFSRRYRN